MLVTQNPNINLYAQYATNIAFKPERNAETSIVGGRSFGHTEDTEHMKNLYFCLLLSNNIKYASLFSLKHCLQQRYFYVN